MLGIYLRLGELKCGLLPADEYSLRILGGVWGGVEKLPALESRRDVGGVLGGVHGGVRDGLEPADMLGKGGAKADAIPYSDATKDEGLPFLKPS